MITILAGNDYKNKIEGEKHVRCLETLWFQGFRRGTEAHTVQYLLRCGVSAAQQYDTFIESPKEQAQSD